MVGRCAPDLVARLERPVTIATTRTASRSPRRATGRGRRRLRIRRDPRYRRRRGPRCSWPRLDGPKASPANGVTMRSCGPRMTSVLDRAAIAGSAAVSRRSSRDRGLANDHAPGDRRAAPARARSLTTQLKTSPRAPATLERYENRLARSLAHVINILDPEVIVLGGGLSNLDRLFRAVRGVGASGCSPIAWICASWPRARRFERRARCGVAGRQPRCLGCRIISGTRCASTIQRCTRRTTLRSSRSSSAAWGVPSFAWPLESIARQDYPAIEAIVVDGPAGSIPRFQRCIGRTGMRFGWCHAPERLKRPKRRPSDWRPSRDWFTFLDDDDTCEPATFRR